SVADGIGARLWIRAGRAGTGADEALRQLGEVRAVTADEVRPGNTHVILQSGVSPAGFGDWGGVAYDGTGIRAQEPVRTAGDPRRGVDSRPAGTHARMGRQPPLSGGHRQARLPVSAPRGVER